MPNSISWNRQEEVQRMMNQTSQYILGQEINFSTFADLLGVSFDSSN
jgi:hypothetical protein